jgi:hypothetical protein
MTPILKPDEVTQRRKELQSDKGRWLRQRQLRYWSGGVGGLLVLASLAVAPVVLLLPTTYLPNLNDGPHRFIILTIAALIAAFGLALLIASGVVNTSLDLLILYVDQELDLLNYNDATPEQRAEALFKLHEQEVKKYYDIARTQSSIIFYVGVTCIALGVIIAGIVLFLVGVQMQGSSVADKIVVGVVGVAGDILADFVAVIFLRMYSSTAASTREFHIRLVMTNQLFYAVVLALKIGDESLRETTLAQMALQTASGVVPNEPISSSDSVHGRRSGDAERHPILGPPSALRG